MRLDRSKSYAEIIGATNGAKFFQNGVEFDFEGKPIIAKSDESAEVATDKSQDIVERVKRKYTRKAS